MSTTTPTLGLTAEPLEPHGHDHPAAGRTLARASLLIGLIALLVVAIGFGVIMLAHASADPRVRRGGHAHHTPDLTMLEPTHTTPPPAAP